MWFKDFELKLCRNSEVKLSHCDIFHRGVRLARVFRRGDGAQPTIFSADAAKDCDEADLNAVLTFAGYYVERDIPVAYLEAFAAREHCNPDYFLGLHNTAIAASALYILSTNEHVFDPETEIGAEPIDMEYLLDRLIQLLDEDALLNIPKDVLAEFVREIDRAAFPLTPEHHAVIERIATDRELRRFFPFLEQAELAISA